MKNKKIDWRIICIGLICITILECFAICHGIDGVVLTSVIGIIALTIGITIPTPKIK